MSSRLFTLFSHSLFLSTPRSAKGLSTKKKKEQRKKKKKKSKKQESAATRKRESAQLIFFSLSFLSPHLPFCFWKKKPLHFSSWFRRAMVKSVTDVRLAGRKKERKNIEVSFFFFFSNRRRRRRPVARPPHHTNQPTTPTTSPIFTAATRPRAGRT